MDLQAKGGKRDFSCEVPRNCLWDSEITESMARRGCCEVELFNN